MSDPSRVADAGNAPVPASSEGEPAPRTGLVAAALAPGRSYHERQRDLVHASLVTPWAPERAPERRQA